MVSSAFFWAGLFLAALAAAGCLFQIAAIIALSRFFAAQPALAGDMVGVTLLKPLYGAEPRLDANLDSFLEQDYLGSIQMVCGVADRSDAAMAVAYRLQGDHPGRDITVVAGSDRTFANRKIANLANMLAAARHEVLVLSDSDMAASPEYLRAVTAALAEPGVGAVTCAYRGRGDTGLWSLLSAGGISYVALPGVVLGYVAGMARPCMGSTIAFTRETLRAIGGFERFADVLADDYAMGEAVAEIGQRVVIAPVLLTHGCTETSFGALWRQKLRWSATIRGVAPWRHLGSIVTYPLPLALLAAAISPTLGLPLVLASVAIRFALAAVVDRHADRASAPYLLLPLIECVEFLAFAGSFVARKIDWRGSPLTIRRDGRIAV
ncbi:bacteriohopanetetrol glucosamine biosynthesis glycosyltransferase HpnI [Novosphingobium sp. G106]|uniref:bacteriohopanetetrol glucosamine biosynthesis glycosyltransferase HpnI n=1 Tax=Novosphingobium sp. G106 TaxID=2849500 RepID=UPI001C2D5CAF|nr:bacteriohopanetetrol glucosamine biosynthesis glycosyltransferase HpnI [Novosphingobium sp. G106]MBV1688647.1 bacteriohopanetetrol glucosamine biosynthesis glycosyltransferase HpnI [Novosphingobium sp. G106]